MSVTASRTHKVAPSTPMPRASRSMVLSFGLFQVGVAWTTLFRADKEIKSHLSCPEHHGPVKMPKWCEHGEHFVARPDRSFDYAGQSVVLSDEELSDIESERDGSVKLRKSCPVESIDPGYFEKSYLLWPTPGKQNEQAYRALLTAIRNTGLALIGQCVVSKTDRMLVIRWSDEHGTLVAHVCNYAANVKADATDLVAEAEQVWPEPSDEFVTQAETLLHSLAGEFDPTDVTNTYQERLENLLACKTSGMPTKVEVLEGGEQTIPDLLAALKASMEAVNENG